MSYLRLCEETRENGAYYRFRYTKDTIYIFYLYKEYNALYSRGAFYIRDRQADELLEKGMISPEDHALYQQRITAVISDIPKLHMMSIEDVYSALYKQKHQMFGTMRIVHEKSCEFTGIDQTDLFEEVLKEKTDVIILLDDPDLSGVYEKLKERLKDRNVYTVYSDRDSQAKDLYQEGLTADLAKIQMNEDLQKSIDENRCLLVFVGEEGFLSCRRLRTDSFVAAYAESYYTKPMVNFCGGLHFVYVPAGTDMTEYVPLTEKTRLTYMHLNELYRIYGRDAYRMKIGEMYEKQPLLFANIYQNDGRVIPLDITGSSDPGQYMLNREQAVSRFLGKYEGVSCFSCYFDGQMNLRDIPYGCTEAQDGILVHAARCSKGHAADVILSDGHSSLRQLMKDSEGVHILSNFLFFMTPKLKMLYNAQRKDRKPEQIQSDSGHLDYMKRNGRESFSLYNKGCFAVMKDGSFRLFDLKTERGTVTVNGRKYDFDESCVNTEEDREIVIHTPYCSLDEPFSDSYCRQIAGNFNIVMIQDQVICAGRNVLLPSIGAVISLREVPEGVRETEDGYYDVSDLKVSVHLDHPLLNDAASAYGGGIILMKDGKDCSTEDLRKEGWMSALSRQTQETEVEKPARHPRTAVGICGNGDLVIMVFSGRSLISGGADYSQMCTAARTVFRDIRDLMNVDGGGSSLLGISSDGVFMELSLPATSATNVAGMGRTVNTALDIRIG